MPNVTFNLAEMRRLICLLKCVYKEALSAKAFKEKLALYICL